MSETIRKIQDNTAVVGVVGLGYVGLPLILAYTAKGYRCIGYDIDQTKIDVIKTGRVTLIIFLPILSKRQ